VAVILSVLVPTDAFLFVLIVSVDVPEPVTVEVLNLALTNFGSPVTLSVTGLLNPACPVIVTVKVVLSPRFTTALVGVTEIEKSELMALTTRVVVVVRVKTPVSPVIVSV